MKVYFAAAAAAAATTLALSANAADVNVIGAHRDTAAAMTMTKDPAARVNVVGAQSPAMMMSADDAARMRPSLRIATKDILDRPTALLNKNTLATDNNVYITRSNVVFTQNDRLAMHEQAATTSTTGTDMSTATLAKNVLRAVSAPQTDDVLMSKAMKREQSIQSEAPRGIVLLLGTKDILRQPTAIINKNMAMTDTQSVVRDTVISPTSNDVVILSGASKVADAVLPASAVKIGQIKSETETEIESSEAEPQYRVAFMYPKSGEPEDTHKEQWGLMGAGWGLGWRYPLGWWNTFGAGLYGGGCGLGFPMGGFFYC
ncbi:hypothetical protein P43SY_000487 [Pythium insidiosum]|uniref:Uncharacterized protein n=1 Tax=Pythium insidiosum TaxID=114742 RepID=A0AAD5Q7W7_PYTIN|nr:hypothetical protein P43SY_000487 [Pythium insidiosum]